MNSLSRADILELSEKYRARASLRAIAEDTGPHINAVNFARVVFETTAAVLVTVALAYTIDALWVALVLSALVMTAVSFVLVGSSPRSVGRAHARVVLRMTAVIIHAVRVVIGPLANALVALGNRVTPGRARFSSFSSEEQLLSMVDEATEMEVLEEDDRELIHSIIEFNDTVVREVMIPRTDMVTVNSGSTVSDAMALFLRHGVSRIPAVAEDDVDDVRGVLYLRDAARLSFERPASIDTTAVDDLLRPALFIPESKKVDDTLRQMQTESNHLAMVVDEYGGIAGLVTMEDLIEELVGEISDEYDRAVEGVEQLGPNRFRVNARLPIDELGELFNLDLEDDEVDTAGGLLTKHVGRLPTKGSHVSVDGLVLTAERVDGRRRMVTSLIVERDPYSDTAGRTAQPHTTEERDERATR